MRVLLISWEYPPVIEGGLGRHVRKLSESLVRDGVEVHVLTRGGGRLPAEADQHGVIVHRVREPQFPRDPTAFVRWVDAMNADMHAMAAEVCDRIEFDLVHSHDWLVAGAAEPAARAIDRPWLVTVHAAPDELLVLLVGRLVYEKGFHLALDALAPVVRRLGGVRFVVAGTGTAESELKRQARRLGLTGHGRFLGWVGDDMLHSLYRVSDLCIVPSIYEPFGLVALEAMASGCLCVVADTGGLREVVPVDGTVGLRFPSRDATALRAVLERVLTDDAARRQLVAEAREHVLRFDWTEVARRTTEIYGLLVGAPTRAG
jgi:glycosyltransferase involved in cell wall biosynthesis